MEEFIKVKRKIQKYSDEFAYCLKRLIDLKNNNDKFSTCLLNKEAPELDDFNEFISDHLNHKYFVEVGYLRHILLTLYVLNINDANEIWHTYFYRGIKEIYYERTVDYRHRKKASYAFYLQLKNN